MTITLMWKNNLEVVCKNNNIENHVGEDFYVSLSS